MWIQIAGFIIFSAIVVLFLMEWRRARVKRRTIEHSERQLNLQTRALNNAVLELIEVNQRLEGELKRLRAETTMAARALITTHDLTH